MYISWIFYGFKIIKLLILFQPLIFQVNKIYFTIYLLMLVVIRGLHEFRVIHQKQ